MRLPPFHRPVSAFALAVVLFAIVIVTTLAVGYVSMVRMDYESTRLYRDSLRSQELAKSVEHWILRDLLDEMASGSTTYVPLDSAGNTVPNKRILEPVRGTDVDMAGGPVRTFPTYRPAKFASAEEQTNIPTLLRRSMSQETYESLMPPGYEAVRPGREPFGLASKISTDTADLSRRSLNQAFWNKAAFIPQSFAEKFQVPEWVYVSRSGPSVLNPTDVSNASKNFSANGQLNPDCVVGRYAFTIYDISGCIDVNVAGNLLTSPENAQRGMYHQIDLKSMPGVATESGNAKLVSWRWPATGSLSDNEADSWGLFDAKRDFISVSPLAGPNGSYDRQFLGRADLIRYARQTGAVSESALPSLTTFSRRLERPSWVPENPSELPSNSLLDYDWEAAATDQAALTKRGKTNDNVGMPLPNRNVNRVTWKNQPVFRDWDGEEISSEEIGDPIVARKFPFSRIALFRQYRQAVTASNTEEMAKLSKAIRYSFGLVPDPAFPGNPHRWVYAEAASELSGIAGGQIVPSAFILTLDQVASQTVQITDPVSGSRRTNLPHEPNFFELLQAAILRGESGFFQASGGGSSAVQWTRGDSLTRAQDILQIGANIIDQYDEDSFPTVVKLYVPSSIHNTTYPLQKLCCGVENLPYLSEVMLAPWRRTDQADGSGRPEVAGLMVFEVWNPHANAATPAAEGPENLRILASQGRMNMRALFDGSGGSAVESAVYGGDTTALNFSATVDCSEPTILDTSNSTTPDPRGTMQDGSVSLNGIYAGTCRLRDSYLEGGTKSVANRFGVQSSGYRNNPVCYELQFKHNEQWIPYQTLFMYAIGDVRDTALATAAQEGLGNPGRPVLSYSPAPYTTYPRTGFQGTVNSSPSAVRLGYFAAAKGNPDPRLNLELFNPGASAHSMAATPGTSLFPNSSTSTVRSSHEDPFITTGTYPDAIATPAIFPSRANGPETFKRDRSPSPQGNFEGRLGWLAYNDVNTQGDTSSINSAGPRLTGRDQITRPGDNIRDKTPHVLERGITEGRPIMLNRPFRSVGDVGVAFRNLPWKTINLWHPLSAEAGIADYFCLNELPRSKPVMAGSFDIASTPAETIELLLTSFNRNELDPSKVITPDQAKEIASDISTFLAQGGPLRTPADLPSSYGRTYRNRFDATYPAIKYEREAVARALSSVMSGRTWNLMFDIVAQTGKFPPNAKGIEAFSVSAQRRLWVHLAIDRYTGSVIDRQIEWLND